MTTDEYLALQLQLLDPAENPLERQQIEAVQRELAELRELARKWPKTEDGTPIVPVMTVWFRSCYAGGLPVVFHVQGIERQVGMGEWLLRQSDEEVRGVAGAYAVYSAALAAGGES